MRTPAEWLVLPLFLVPLAGALAFVGWVVDAHARARAPLADGETALATWLEPETGAASGLGPRIVRAFAPSRAPFGPDAAFVPFRHAAGDGAVRCPASAMGREAWRFAAVYPAGVPARALGDAGARLALETGRAAVDLDDPEPASVELRELLRRPPDLATLREAPLPAAMKHFVLRRWQAQGHDVPWLNESAAFTDLAARYLTARSIRGDRLEVGAHQLGDLLVLASDGAWPPWIFPPDARPSAYVITYTDDDRGASTRLTWAFPPAAPTRGRVLWSGWREAAPAGFFAFVAHEDEGWWQSARFRRWIGPVVILLGAFFLIPTMLLVSLRRRRRLDDARVRFLNELAHDLRTPLTSLRLHADLLSQGRAPPEGRAQHLGQLSHEAGRLTSLLANLLDLSRLERGRRSFAPEALRVEEVVEQALGDFRALHPGREADVSTEGDPELRVRADRTALQRSLANLLDNAGKFTMEGTPVRVSWERASPRVLVRVADDGPGVPPAERSRIFRRYERGDVAKRDGVPGTGLGLALVKELVEGMEGTVRLEESAGGTSFVLRLPEAPRA